MSVAVQTSHDPRTWAESSGPGLGHGSCSETSRTSFHSRFKPAEPPAADKSKAVLFIINITGCCYSFMILVFKMCLWCVLHCFMSAAELQQRRHRNTQICSFIFSFILLFHHEYFMFQLDCFCLLFERKSKRDRSRKGVTNFFG